MGLSELFREVLASYYGRKKQRLENRMLLYRYLYRPLSLPITVVFLKLRVSANQATVLGFLVLVVSLLLLGQGGALGPWGIAGYFIFFVLDFVDGNIARFNGTASYFGKLFDGMVDAVGFLIFIAVAAHNVNSGASVLPSWLELVLGTATTITALLRQNYMFRLAHLKREAGIAPEIAGVGEPEGSNGGGLGRVAALVYDNLAVSAPVVLPVAVLAGLASAFTVLFFVLHGVIGVAGILYSLVKNHRALAAVDRQH